MELLFFGYRSLVTEVEGTAWGRLHIRSSRRKAMHFDDVEVVETQPQG